MSDERDRPTDPPTPIERVTYAALVRTVSQRERVAMTDVRRILDAAVASILETTESGGRVSVGRLGSFRGDAAAGSGDGSGRLRFRRSQASASAGPDDVSGQ